MSSSRPRRPQVHSRPDRSGRPAASRTRPGARATSRAPGVGVAAPKTRFTSRMAVFVLVVLVLVVSYASSMRAYLGQSGQISGLQAQVASSQKQARSLRAELQRWKDPAYVRQQARARLNWVLAGETAYQVIGADGRPLAGTEELGRAVVPPTTPEAWWTKQYDSLQAADHPDTYNVVPTPLSKITPGQKSGQNSGKSSGSSGH